MQKQVGGSEADGLFLLGAAGFLVRPPLRGEGMLRRGAPEIPANRPPGRAWPEWSCFLYHILPGTAATFLQYCA